MRARMRGPSVRVEAEHPERARRDRGHARDHAHGRGLAGPVRSEETERLAPLDLEVDPVDGDEVAEPLDEAGADTSGSGSDGQGGAPGVEGVRQGDPRYRPGAGSRSLPGPTTKHHPRGSEVRIPG